MLHAQTMLDVKHLDNEWAESDLGRKSAILKNKATLDDKKEGSDDSSDSNIKEMQYRTKTALDQLVSKGRLET